MASVAWERDSNYSDHRYGVEKILTFPSVNMVAANAIKFSMVLTEDIVLTEIGGFVTTIISSAADTTITVNASGAADTVLATLNLLTLHTAGILARETTITNATAGVTGQVLLIKIAASAQSGVITPYIKYRSEFN